MSIRKLFYATGLSLLPLCAAAGLPTPAQVQSAYQSSDAQLLDRHGEPLQSLRIDMSVRRLAWVNLADISAALPAAVMQAEDRHFYQHRGVDIEALGTAAWDTLIRQRPRGASTISMQLASLLEPSLQPAQGKRNLVQKWDQIQAARELERGWSKDQILEAYLNLLTFRGELQGIGAASHVLFGKIPSGLNEIESSLLAALIRAPNASSKLVARRACAQLTERHAAIPCRVVEAEAARAFARASAYPTVTPSGAAQVAQKLLKRPAEKRISTLDGPLQRFVLDSLHQQLAALKTRNVNDGAVVVLDNDSGDILAYVGNAGESMVDGVAALRQAGSTLKPFLYELAIEKKQLTAASIMDDSPIDISTPAGLYVPQNYDKDFKGYVSVRTSLASSLNVPAVRALIMTGMESFYNRLKDLGISSLVEPADYYGYSLALGSAEVSLLELSNAYRTLAAGGMSSPARLTPDGSAVKRIILDTRAAYIVNDILSDRAARSVTFGLSNDLATPYWSAAKTGTSKDMRDNWCIGFNGKYTVGVWVGNFDGQPMWNVSGVTGAAPVWRDIMDFLQKDTPVRTPIQPRGVLSRQIEFMPQIEASRKEWFLAGTESTRIEIVPEAGRLPRIRYPGNGSIIALDPDIPDTRQRLLFQAQAGNGLTWKLDGALLGAADVDVPWKPLPGEHRLSLQLPDGKEIDSIAFQVRGSLRQ